MMLYSGELSFGRRESKVEKVGQTREVTVRNEDRKEVIR